ncbi:MAG: hypothetical protein SwBeaMacB_13770 [Shewanella algae]
MSDKRGGARKGAGRPKGSGTAEPTKMVRVPVGCLDDVRALIEKYRSTVDKDGQTDWIGRS